MEEPTRLILGRAQYTEQLHDRVFGKPAHGQAGDGDADLRKRQIVADAIDDDDRVLGRLDALPGQFLEASPAHSHDGELRRNPCRVEEYQRENGENWE